MLGGVGMHFLHCPYCGKRLIYKEIGDEGKIPYCTLCEVPLWDMFTSCVICAVVNEFNEIVLLQQNYVSRTTPVCVAGIMKLGESAEETVMREVEEETGLKVYDLQYIQSYPYDKKSMLMLGFLAQVNKKEFVLSGEVDSASWFSFDEAIGSLREGSIAYQLVKQVKEILGE